MQLTAHALVIEETKNNSFTTQLITKIVDNLQVTVKNIHFRYEDSVSHPDKELFSFGCTLEELSVVSTDENWEEAFIADAVDKVYKRLNLGLFSVYWDSWSKTSFRGLPLEELSSAFLSRIHLEDDQHHVLKPINGFANVPIVAMSQS